jgi:hypothetical protein
LLKDRLHRDRRRGHVETLRRAGTTIVMNHSKHRSREAALFNFELGSSGISGKHGGAVGLSPEEFG